MLLSDLVLSKRGPLAKVWLSAHHERKLTKQQTLNVDIEDSCGAILGQTDDDPIALRIKGQLMLGVTRIYGRQTQYLLEDCRDTRERITAFQPGLVDLPEDQIRAQNAAITLPQLSDATIAVSAMDLYDWGSQVPSEPLGLHTAPLTQTNLRTSREYGAYNFGRPAALSIYGGSVGSRSASVETLDVTSKLDSHEFAPFDLGLDDLEVDMSMEIGRDRLSEARSASPHAAHRPSDISGFEGDDFSMGPIDLELDMELPDLAASDPNRSSSPASSALTTPPPESPPPMPVSPNTAKRLAEAAVRKVKRVRVMRPDDNLELPEEAFAEDDPEWQVEPRFIPRRDATVHLCAVARDASHFLPTSQEGGERYFYAGPSDMGPLSDLFTFPAHVLRRPRPDDPGREGSPKRPRIEGELDVDFEVEEARRRSRTHTPFLPDASGLGFELPEFPDATFGEFGGFPSSSPARAFSRAQSLDYRRAESIARAVQGADDDGAPLAVFDGGDALSSRLGSEGVKEGGFSKTTGMAMGVLRREIEAIESTLPEPDEIETGTQPGVSFAKVARGATKRAASQFFFELLVLGTRDAVQLKQDKAYGDIEVLAKPKLWERPPSSDPTELAERARASSTPTPAPGLAV